MSCTRLALEEAVQQLAFEALLPVADDVERAGGVRWHFRKLQACHQLSATLHGVEISLIIWRFSAKHACTEWTDYMRVSLCDPDAVGAGVRELVARSVKSMHE